MITRLHEAIEAVCPIHGVCLSPPVRIDFKAEATPEQRALAATVLASFDFTPRKRRARLAIIQDIAALSSPDRNKLIAGVVADYLIANPTFAKSLNISIDGDEV